MTRVVFVVAVSGLVLFGCAPGVRTSADPSSPATCVGNQLWRLPDEMPLNAQPTEKLSYAILVTKARLNSIALAAAVACREAGGTFPSSYRALLESALNIAPPLAACALDEAALVDGWGWPIYYQGGTGVLIVRSPGPDGRFTSDDDISLPSPGSPDGESLEIDRNCRPRPSLRRPAPLHRRRVRRSDPAGRSKTPSGAGSRVDGPRVVTRRFVWSVYVRPITPK